MLSKKETMKNKVKKALQALLNNIEIFIEFETYQIRIRYLIFKGKVKISQTMRADVIPMFLRFIDHRVRLFLMVSNHRPTDAMFAMNRSNLVDNNKIIF